MSKQEKIGLGIIIFSILAMVIFVAGREVGGRGQQIIEKEVECATTTVKTIYEEIEKCNEAGGYPYLNLRDEFECTKRIKIEL
jgi:hypothetical protein